jgi:hypothetical protein
MKTWYCDFDFLMQVAEEKRTIVGIAISETWYRHNNMPTQVPFVGINRRSLKTWHVYVFSFTPMAAPDASVEKPRRGQHSLSGTSC